MEQAKIEYHSPGETPKSHDADKASPIESDGTRTTPSEIGTDSADSPGKNKLSLALKNVWVYMDPLIFGYNSYAVVWNIFYADSGFLLKLIFSVIGLTINLLIVLAYPRVLRKAFPELISQKFKTIVANSILAIFLLIGVMSARRENVSVIEETASEAVSSLLKDELGEGAATCVFVKLGKHLGSGLYQAKAMLSTAKEIDISVRDRATGVEVQIANE